MTAPADLDLPRAFSMCSPFADALIVRDTRSGRAVPKLDSCDQDAGWYSLQHWDEATGTYAPRRFERPFTIELLSTASRQARDHFRRKS